MRQFLFGLSVTAVFGLGCVAGAASFGVAPARAASAAEQRFAYFCFEAGSAEDVHVKANAAGARGWELVAAVASPAGRDGSSGTWCFKKPARPQP